ncbi:Methyl-accepting chemotaxis protein, partial [Pseudomonas syringae pv. philadelphi]
LQAYVKGTDYSAPRGQALGAQGNVAVAALYKAQDEIQVALQDQLDSRYTSLLQLRQMMIAMCVIVGLLLLY